MPRPRLPDHWSELSPDSCLDDGVEVTQRMPHDQRCITQWIKGATVASTTAYTESYVDDGADMLIPQAGAALGQIDKTFYKDNPVGKRKKQKYARWNPVIQRAVGGDIKHTIDKIKTASHIRIKVKDSPVIGGGEGKEIRDTAGLICLPPVLPTFVVRGDNGHVFVVDDKGEYDSGLQQQHGKQPVICVPFPREGELPVQYLPSVPASKRPDSKIDLHGAFLLDPVPSAASRRKTKDERENCNNPLMLPAQSHKPRKSKVMDASSSAKFFHPIAKSPTLSVHSDSTSNPSPTALTKDIFMTGGAGGWPTSPQAASVKSAKWSQNSWKVSEADAWPKAPYTQITKRSKVSWKDSKVDLNSKSASSLLLTRHLHDPFPAPSNPAFGAGWPPSQEFLESAYKPPDSPQNVESGWRVLSEASRKSTDETNSNAWEGNSNKGTISWRDNKSHAESYRPPTVEDASDSPDRDTAGEGCGDGWEDSAKVHSQDGGWGNGWEVATEKTSSKGSLKASVGRRESSFKNGYDDDDETYLNATWDGIRVREDPRRRTRG